MTLRRRALPDRDLDSVTLRTMLFGRALEAPLLFMRDGTLRGVGELVLAVQDAVDYRGGKEAWRAAEAAGAHDGLFIRTDPLGGALREPGGDTAYAGALAGIEAAVARVSPLPVIAGGPGFAMDYEDVVALAGAGVGAIDVGHADALVDARVAAPGMPLLVSSGVGDGWLAAEFIALGATAIVVGEDQVAAFAEDIRTAAWLAGVGHVQELGAQHLR